MPSAEARTNDDLLPGVYMSNGLRWNPIVGRIALVHIGFQSVIGEVSDSEQTSDSCDAGHTLQTLYLLGRRRLISGQVARKLVDLRDHRRTQTKDSGESDQSAPDRRAAESSSNCAEFLSSVDFEQ